MNDMFLPSNDDFGAENSRFLGDIELTVRLLDRVPNVHQTEPVVPIIALRGTVPLFGSGCVTAGIGNTNAYSFPE